MTTPIPTAHLLTCPARAASLAATLASWRACDWGSELRIYCDAEPEPERAGEEWGRGARARRLTDAFAGLLRFALETAGLQR